MDKFKVVANNAGHGFNIGDIVVRDNLNPDQYWHEDMRDWWMCGEEDVEPYTTNTLTVGETYTANNGSKWECIYVRDDKAWMAGIFEGDMNGVGYLFTLDGVSLSLNDQYNIKFEPVVEVLTVQGGFVTGSLENTTVHPNYADHEFTLTINLIDGVPDWTQAKVDPVE